MINKTIESHPAWAGELSHLDAEKLLKGKPIGSYVIHKGDKLTNSVRDTLSLENHKQVNCWVLTLNEEGGKISDILLVQMEGKWFFYFDDPDLVDDFHPKYDSFKELLLTLKEKAKFPLGKEQP